jgi:hypothetical protein
VLDQADPAKPEARACFTRRRAPAAARPADALAGEHQQRGEQRQRCGEDEQHAE